LAWADAVCLDAEPFFNNEGISSALNKVFKIKLMRMIVFLLDEKKLQIQFLWVRFWVHYFFLFVLMTYPKQQIKMLKLCSLQMTLAL